MLPLKVDVHTHIWPDRIAEATLESMTRTVGMESIAPNTIAGIKAHMAESGVDKSIVLGIVERAGQVRRANDWLISIQDEQLVPFGAMHPDLEDKGAEIARLRENGIKGIKLHPMINGFYPDDPKMFPVYEEMGESMVLEIHCGRLPHAGNPVRKPAGKKPAGRKPASRKPSGLRRSGADHEPGPAVPQTSGHCAASGRVLHAGRSGAGADRKGEYSDRHHLAALLANPGEPCYPKPG